MNKYEFDNSLRENNKYKAYMLYGQSEYLVELYTKLVLKKISENEDTEKLYFDEYNFKYAKDKLLQSSLFSSSNILLIKLDKKLPKKEVDELIKAANTNPDSSVIFTCLGDATFKGMERSFTPKLNAVSVRFFQPKDYEAIKYLEDEAKKVGLNYEQSALNHLYFMHKNNLSFCLNDLVKLSALEQKITSNIIDTHCFGIEGIAIDDFLHNLLSAKDISGDLERLFEKGTNEIFLLTQIISFVQQLFMISAYTRVNGVPNPIEILGYKPPKHIWDRKTKLAISIKPNEFQKMLSYLLDIELELKTSKIDKIDSFIIASLSKFTVLFR